MKGIFMFTALTIQLLAMDGFAQTPTREDLRKTLVHIQQLTAEMKAENVSLKSDLATAQVARVAGEARIAQLNTDIDRMRQWGVDQQTLKNDALADVAKYQKQLAGAQKDLAAALARYHWLKFLCASIAGALAAFLALRFSGPLQLNPLYLAIAVAAAFAAGFSLIFLTL